MQRQFLSKVQSQDESILLYQGCCGTGESNLGPRTQVLSQKPLTPLPKEESITMLYARKKSIEGN